tara:strand:+ start:164 stop:343 length:180 start_codon:yes stop_codon:yes gene_type:complete
MEDLELIIDKEDGCSLHIESLEDEKVYLTINYFGDANWFRLNKDQAKQIVEHLTKVFEL